MPLNFPPNPSVNQTSTQNGRVFRWTGSAWEFASTSPTDDARWNMFLPPAPTGLTATAGNAQVSLSWTAPTVLTQTPITDYAVQFSSNSGSTWTTFSDGTSTSTSATVTGLTNGTAYVFRVAAVNGVGIGSYTAASASVTPTASGGITMQNRYVGGVLGAYTNWTISGSGTSASPAVGTMRGDIDASEWRFTALASGTLTITAKNVSQSEGWGNWYVRTVGGTTNLAQGDSTTNNVTRTVSVTGQTQYAISTYVGGVDFSMRIA